MKNLQADNFVNQLRKRQLSLEYFMSQFDVSDTKLYRDCYQQLTFTQLRTMQLQAIYLKRKLKWYNIISKINVANCLINLDQLIIQKIQYSMPLMSRSQLNKILQSLQAQKSKETDLKEEKYSYCSYEESANNEASLKEEDLSAILLKK